MEIFKLFGSIFVDSAAAEKSISKTGQEAETMGGKLASGIKTAAAWGTALIGAATAVGGAMVAAAKDTAAELDVVDKASQRMGIAAESYQELAYAAGLSGVNMSTLEKAAKSLVGTDLTFDDALDQIMALGSESERTQAAVEMFGEKVAYDMQPLLKAGADGLAGMKQEANDLGLVMSQDTVTAGAAMNDMFSKVEQTLSRLKNGLMADIMPYVMEILQFLIDNIPAVKETVQNVMEAIMPIIEPILKGVLELVKSVFALLNGDFDTFKDSALKALKLLLEGMINLVQLAIELTIKIVKNLGKALFTAGKEAFEALLDGIKETWQKIEKWVSSKVEWLADKLKFWENSSSKMESDNLSGKASNNNTIYRHASGLAYVPYDGYKAELHKGEAVLTAQEVKRGKINTGGNTFNFTFNSPKAITPAEANRQAKRAYRDLQLGF